MRKKLILIQFSRALVPLMVMLFHVSLMMNEYFGFNILGLSALPMSGGVNYFYALSGFMVYYIYRDKLKQPGQLKPYLLNRFIRIYPLYWLLTLILLPFLFIFPWYGAGHETDTDIMFASLFLIPNPRELEPILIVAWSLVHTVFFYLVFSILFLKQQKLAKWLVGTWVALIVIFTYGYIPVDHYLLRFIFDETGLIFMGGISCAYLVLRYKVHPNISVLLILMGLLGFPLMWVSAVNPFMPINFDEGTGLASLFLILGLASIDLQKEIVIPNFLNYLGNAAFSIYLSHTIILDFVSEMFIYFEVYPVLGGWLISFILILCMLFGGCLVHSYVEKPLQRKAKQLLLKKKIPAENSGAGVLVKEPVKID